MTKTQMGGITSKAEANSLAAPTDPSTLSDKQTEAVRKNSVTLEAMRERLTERADEAKQQETFADADAYGLSGLAQGMPREIGQPTAVKVRISNPDKL